MMGIMCYISYYNETLRMTLYPAMTGKMRKMRHKRPHLIRKTYLVFAKKSGSSVRVTSYMSATYRNRSSSFFRTFSQICENTAKRALNSLCVRYLANPILLSARISSSTCIANPASENIRFRSFFALLSPIDIVTYMMASLNGRVWV